MGKEREAGSGLADLSERRFTQRKMEAIMIMIRSMSMRRSRD
jgi:hypothetical protein